MTPSGLGNIVSGSWRTLLFGVITGMTMIQSQQSVRAYDVVAAPAAGAAVDDDAVDEAALLGNADENSWMTDENFNQWVFNASGGGRTSPTQARQRLTDLAKAEIGLVERLCSLNDLQKQKLELAARGDIIRLFDRIEKARAELPTQRRKRVNFQDFWKVVQKLQVEVSTDRFGSGTMFRKTLLLTLTSEQKSKYLAIERVRRDRRNRARVASAIAHLETFVPLVSNQRQRLTELIEKETVNAVDVGRYDTHVMLYRIGKIPEAKLKPVLDPVQLRVFTGKLAEYSQIGQWLAQQGLLRDEPPDVDDESKSQLSGK